MIGRFKAWPEEWGILFTLAIHSKPIYGKVRLNKALALLQRDGFPIGNKFVNGQMGPYDEKIDYQTERLEKEGFISIEIEDTEYDNPLYIYKMTKEGEIYYRNEKSRMVQQLNELPFSRLLSEYLQVIEQQIKMLRTNNMIDMVHNELYLDDYQTFLNKLKENKYEIGKVFKTVENKFDDNCPICLEILGALDFANMALNEIEKKCNTDPYSGKNFILYNTEKLLAASKSLMFHKHIIGSEVVKEEVSRNRESILHRLHCIEYNGMHYDIIQPVKIIEDESGFLVCNL